ncbi:MAG: exodeoxyribonuclease VII large subunit, partial [Deltaproteobacteria bacterium]|nr:exodeoxyribonuclease VII large subunit [Deltaproteobacteria bacterium]
MGPRLCRRLLYTTLARVGDRSPGRSPPSVTAWWCWVGPVEAEKYTVAGLVGEINDVLSGEFDDVWVEGEIGGFKVAASGHWYFSLKDQDDDAVLNCAMFAGANRSVRKRPKDG